MMGAWRMGEEEGAGLTERNQTENEPKVTVTVTAQTFSFYSHEQPRHPETPHSLASFHLYSYPTFSFHVSAYEIDTSVLTAVILRLPHYKLLPSLYLSFPLSLAPIQNSPHGSEIWLLLWVSYVFVVLSVARTAVHGGRQEALGTGGGAAVSDEVPQRSPSQGQRHR